MRELSITIDEAELPPSVRGECAKDADGRFYIVINKCLSETERVKTFLHEMLHIYHDDFASEEPVAAIEAARHLELTSPRSEEMKNSV